MIWLLLLVVLIAVFGLGTLLEAALWTLVVGALGAVAVTLAAVLLLSKG